MKTIFYLLILLLPTQLGKHFWPDFSFVQGIRVDYLSPTIYVTDILIILIFLGWLFTSFAHAKTPGIIAYFTSEESRSLPRHHPRWLPGAKLVVFVVLVFIGSILSVSPFAGFYGLLKFIEFTLFGFFVAKTVKEVEFKNILVLLSVGIIFQSLVAITQFINQGSLGGIFWFLGERTFSSQTPGIANAVINGQLILRPYGTFPHPNVLAGFLVIAMTLAISNLKSKNLSILFSVALIAGLLGLLLTMSRVAIILWLLVMGHWFIVNFKRNRLIFLFVVLVLIGSIGNILFPRFTELSLTDETIVRRQELAVAAIEMVKSSPFFGVGLNNFLVNLPNFSREAGQATSSFLYLQPVHNIYLLIAAETGIVGLAIFLWFLFKTYQRLKLSTFNPALPAGRFQLSTTLFAILILGLFDHYWITIQQGQLLLALVLGLCWNRQK